MKKPAPFTLDAVIYKVIQNGEVVAEHKTFVDAWLDIYLRFRAYAKVVGPDGEWIINPYGVN
jgi:hypothetical protein